MLEVSYNPDNLPTYSLLEVLRTLHDPEADKEEVWTLIDVVQMECRKYPLCDLYIIRDNLDIAAERLNQRSTPESNRVFEARMRFLNELVMSS